MVSDASEDIRRFCDEEEVDLGRAVRRQLLSCDRFRNSCKKLLSCDRFMNSFTKEASLL